MAKKKNPAAVALGRRGGQARLRKYGRKAMVQMAKQSRRAILEKYPDYYRQIRQGLKPTKI